MGISRKYPPQSPPSSNPDKNNNLPRELPSETSSTKSQSQIGVFRGRKPSRFLLRFGAVSDLSSAASMNSSRYNPYNGGNKGTGTSGVLHDKEKKMDKGTFNSVLSQHLSYSDALKRNVEKRDVVNECASAASSSIPDCKDSVILQICNLDANCEEPILRQYLLGQLKSITPVLSLTIETPTMAKLKVPSMSFAKQVVAHMHRKKFGHKRIVVSYLRDPSSAETSALKSQVAGLLKDIPGHSLPVYKFRELFQTRFKSTVSILELYRMSEVCTIDADDNDEKTISLNSELVTSVQGSSLVEQSQHSVPYCIYHFRQTDRGWAEQELEPLPNVRLTIPQIQGIVHALLRGHQDDIPIASILYCMESELSIRLQPHEQGVNLEHLISCCKSVQIAPNTFGIKVLSWIEESSLEKCDMSETSSNATGGSGRGYSRNNLDPLSLISRETIELIKLNPNCTMKFNRFIPAYHNHFGKQCRVADYGYTRLIELFEALSSVVQVMGDGENRLITLTHSTQARRFSNDLFKVLRIQPTKSILLSQLPLAFTSYQNYPFNITDYGVCSVRDMLEGLNHNNSIVLQPIHNGSDMLISIMKRKQTMAELEKTCTFAVEVVELLRNAAQYSILFKKFVRSYHYHFGYQCRLSDYGFTKLMELLEAIGGVVKVEDSPADDDRKIVLCQKIALRVFSEQLQDLVKHYTTSTAMLMRVEDVLQLHKNKFGYQMAPQTLGFNTLRELMMQLPYIELFDRSEGQWMMSHLNDTIFRNRCYAAVLLITDSGSDKMMLPNFINLFNQRFGEMLTEKMIFDMKHALAVLPGPNGNKMVMIHMVMKFILSIVSVLEKNGNVNILQLKNMMQIPTNYCFEFGYPSVAALIQDHMDVFLPLDATATHVHERSDITLQADCIFTKAGFKKYLDQCKQKSSTSLANQEKKTNPHPQSFKPINYTYQPVPGSMHQSSLNYNNFPKPTPQILSMDTGNPNNCFRNCPCLNTAASFQPTFSRNNWPQQHRIPTQGPPPPLPQNHNSYCNSNCSDHWPSSNLHQQQSASSQNERRGSSDFATLTDLFGLPNWDKTWNFQQNFYEPPKPDTPPTCQIPVWFDPIWKNSPCESRGGGQVTSLNIQLPELKTVIMPVITGAGGGDFTRQGGGYTTSGRAAQGFEYTTDGGSGDDFGKCDKDSSNTNSSF